MLRYGIREEELSLCILVVSSDVFCAKLSDAIYNCSKKQGGFKLLIHECRRVQDVINVAVNPRVDFIVYGIDTRVVTCLEEVEKDIKVSSTAFTLGRMCFVHDDGIKLFEMAVSYNDVWDLQSKYGGYILAGSVASEAKCLYLAKRILKLISTVSGVNSGLPYIWCPGLNVEQ
jgi:Centromere protein M (CENP-M).